MRKPGEGEMKKPIVQRYVMWKEAGSKRNYPKSSSDLSKSTVQILVCWHLFMHSVMLFDYCFAGVRAVVK